MPDRDRLSKMPEPWGMSDDGPGIIELHPAGPRRRSTQPLHDPAVAHRVPIVLDGAGAVPRSRALVPPGRLRCGDDPCRYCGNCHSAGCPATSVICADAQEDLMRRDRVPADEPKRRKILGLF